MVKLALGPSTSHMYASRGGEYTINRFYHTRYNHDYGNEFFKPRTGSVSSSGYASNIRPQMFYSKSLDEFDNPYMGQLLAGNYQSITRRHFNKPHDSDGKDPFSKNVFKNGVISGFTEEKYITNPTKREARSVHFDTRDYGAYSRSGLHPKYLIPLKKIDRKDIVENENFCHGPSYMRSEMKTRFKEQQQSLPWKLIGKDIGNLEASGDVNNKNIEPITFKNDDAFLNDLPRECTNRPTGISLTKECYLNSKGQNGREPFPTITNTSEKYNGFTRKDNLMPSSQAREGYTKIDEYPPIFANQVMKKDPAEYFNLIHTDNKISMMKGQFLGLRQASWNEATALGKEETGNKELSGDCRNNMRYMETKNVDRQKYLTTSKLKHFDMNPRGNERQGWVFGGVQPAKLDGFTKNNTLQTYGRNIDENKVLLQLDPYVSRSIKRNDQFFGENIHLHKIPQQPVDFYKKVNPLSTATLEAR